MTLPAPFTSRPATSADEAFLFRLYASTRAEELAPLGWNPAQCDAFLRGQFAAQRAHFRTTFPHAAYSVLLRTKLPLGATVVHRGADELRLVDIALLPEYRGAGLGSHLLRALITEAQAANLPLRLHVLKNSPAARWYARFGFTPLGEQGLYLKMEQRPDGSPPARA